MRMCFTTKLVGHTVDGNVIEAWGHNMCSASVQQQLPGILQLKYYRYTFTSYCTAGTNKNNYSKLLTPKCASQKKKNQINETLIYSMFITCKVKYLNLFLFYLTIFGLYKEIINSASQEIKILWKIFTIQKFRIFFFIYARNTWLDSFSTNYCISEAWHRHCLCFMNGLKQL